MLLRGLKNERLQRRNNITVDGSPITWNNYDHPFDKLPLLESHIHPKFVIFNAGRKMHILQLQVQKVVNESVFSPRLGFVLHLYEAWIRTLPPNSKTDQSYLAPVDNKVTDDDGDDGDGVDVDDENDEDYEPGPTKKKKPVDDENDEDYEPGPKKKKKPARSKRKRSGTGSYKVLSASSSYNQHCLSKVTLSRLLDLEGDASWTDDRIRDWSNPFQTKFRTRKKIRL